MVNHSNIAPAVKLAARLYSEQLNKSVPTWDQLVPYGACQQTWIKQAERMILLQDLPGLGLPVADAKLDLDALVAGLDDE